MTTLSALNQVQSIPRDDDGPVFAEPWQAQAFAMAVSLNEKGLFSWSEWVDIISTEIARDGDPHSYYHHWLTALEIILDQKNVISTNDRHVRIKQWDEAARTTPHGQPITLKPQ